LSDLLVFDVIKTPFGDVSCVRVMSKALIGFIFKFLGSSKHSCELNNAIESPSPPRTFTGHSLERGQWIISFPQCAKREGFVEFVDVPQK